jgi:hypothetical protein
MIRYVFHDERKKEKRRARKKENTLTQVYALMMKMEKRLGAWSCSIGCVGIGYIDLIG